MKTKSCRSVRLALAGALALSAGGCLWNPFAATPLGVGAGAGIELVDVTAAPIRHAGVYVTVTGRVERLVSKDVFFISSRTPVLVIIPEWVTPNSAVEVGRPVQVSGEVRLTEAAGLRTLVRDSGRDPNGEMERWVSRVYGESKAVPFLAAVSLFPGR